MAHKLLGTHVRLFRPVVVKPGFTRQNEDTGKPPEHVESVVKMEECDGTIIGVEVGDPSSLPKVHVSYYDPANHAHVSGSGWRDAFERLDSVRPRSHSDVEPNSNIPFYVNDDVEDEVDRLRYEKSVKLAEAETQSLQGVGDGAPGAHADPSGSPTAEDLDQTAGEQKAADDTAV